MGTEIDDAKLSSPSPEVGGIGGRWTPFLD
jgi:hypothetical protein